MSSTRFSHNFFFYLQFKASFSRLFFACETETNEAIIMLPPAKVSVGQRIVIDSLRDSRYWQVVYVCETQALWDNYFLGMLGRALFSIRPKTDISKELTVLSFTIHKLLLKNL